jgi:hypothetical protein
MRELPKFDPPKPAPIDAVKAMLDLMTTTFTSDAFRSSLRRVFQQVGLAKTIPTPHHSMGATSVPIDPYWVQYTASGRGTLNCKVNIHDCGNDVGIPPVMINTIEEARVMDTVVVQENDPPRQLRALEFSLGADLLPIESRSESSAEEPLDNDNIGDEDSGEGEVALMSMAAMLTALLHDGEESEEKDDDNEVPADREEGGGESNEDTSMISDLTDDSGVPLSHGGAALLVVENADGVEYAGQKKGEVQLEATSQAGWLFLHLYTFRAEEAAMIMSSLASYELFVAVCETYPIISLRVSQEMVANNYYTLRPDGWCWYSLYCNLYLVRSGQEPRILCYEDPNDVATLSEAMDYCIDRMTEDMRNHVQPDCYKVNKVP